MPLPYLGRAPDTDLSILTKSYVDDHNAQSAVTDSWTSTQVAQAAQHLTDKTHVDAGDDTKAKKADVLAADTDYLPVTALNTTGGIDGLDSSIAGIAGVDSNKNLIGTQVPTQGVITDRIVTSYSLTSPNSGPQLVSPITTTSSDPKAVLLARVTTEDPGWPWVPQVFGAITGFSPDSVSPGTSTDNFGVARLYVADSDQIYALALCAGDATTMTYPVFSYADKGDSPTTIPPLTGPQVFELYGSLWTGQHYTFVPSPMSLTVLQVSAL